MPSRRSNRGVGLLAANQAPGDLLDKAAIATMATPVVGDVLGLLADSRAFYREPTVGNAVGGLLGAMPFVPAAAVARQFSDVVKPLRGEPTRAINEARKAKKAEPVTVYHGTGADFTEFDPEMGIGGQTWFTSRKEKAASGYDGAAGRGRLVEAQIDIRNPAGWKEYDKYTLDELMAMGYDGLKLDDGDEIVYATFFPEQIQLLQNTKVK